MGEKSVAVDMGRPARQEKRKRRRNQQGAPSHLFGALQGLASKAAPVHVQDEVADAEGRLLGCSCATARARCERWQHGVEAQQPRREKTLLTGIGHNGGDVDPAGLACSQRAPEGEPKGRVLAALQDNHTRVAPLLRGCRRLVLVLPCAAVARVAGERSGRCGEVAAVGVAALPGAPCCRARGVGQQRFGALT